MIALVTGANRGIGREVARQLADAGHTVFLTARSAEAAAEAARAAGPGAHPLRLDVTSEATSPRSPGTSPPWTCWSTTRRSRTTPGSARPTPTWTSTEAAETNLYGPWRLTQALLPLRGPARTRGSSTSPASSRPSRPWAAAPPRTRRPRRPSTPSPACSPPNWAPTGSSSTPSVPARVATDMGGPGGRPVRGGRRERRMGGDPPGRRPDRRLLPRRAAPAVVATGSPGRSWPAGHQVTRRVLAPVAAGSPGQGPRVHDLQPRHGPGEHHVQRCRPRASASATAAGSTATTWSYSSPLARVAGTTANTCAQFLGPRGLDPGGAQRLAHSPDVRVGRDDADGTLLRERAAHRVDGGGQYVPVRRGPRGPSAPRPGAATEPAVRARRVVPAAGWRARRRLPAPGTRSSAAPRPHPASPTRAVRPTPGPPRASCPGRDPRAP